MSLLRDALLAGSQSAWLRRRATRSRLARRAVSRFMPGETLEDALRAAAALREHRLGSLLTFLGENVSDAAEAEAVTRHYLRVAERGREAGLDAEVSVKLTQLGLDLSPDLALANLDRIAGRAHELDLRIWIDMESTPYVDPTLDAYRRARASNPNLGVCLQAYLYRTPADVESLIPLGASIRLVKGAYREPRHLASPSKHDVDERFYSLAVRLLSEEARRAGVRLTLGTHDTRLIGRIAGFAESSGIPRDGCEIAMLYGIQSREQRRLALEGYRVRVLISYGTFWFPWYMRRLAERPANLVFALRSLFVS